MDWGSVHTIFDVGANVGAASRWFSEVAARAEIIALEPAAETFRSLTLNIKENGLCTRVRAMQVALGGAPGVGRIVPGIASGATHVSQTGAGPEVPIITLESLLRSTAVAEVDLMKLDCEGAEYSSLLNASPTALRRIRVMVGEYHLDPTHTAEDIRRVLIDAGFDVGLRPRTEPAPRNLGDAAGFFVARRT